MFIFNKLYEYLYGTITGKAFIIIYVEFLNNVKTNNKCLARYYARKNYNF